MSPKTFERKRPIRHFFATVRVRDFERTATVCSRYKRIVYKRINPEKSIYRRIKSTTELTNLVNRFVPGS